ncbi:MULTISPECIES: DUF732 domain-containing protein [Subtercola]|uniref:DUF732 domain-containing protein n=1 Tax=Subtercola vilae TaxID=2056433 RepID=A0A4T2C0H6_9MICO|nr:MULTISPECIES: DUF732 domain-containing protein [Subtercola]MEA9985148.1 DUF732 domain-containing protein [Subtercola sp. RTI3]TIH37655.1 hypothetical protein D4765_07660 [Subtercola vilae]
MMFSAGEWVRNHFFLACLGFVALLLVGISVSSVFATHSGNSWNQQFLSSVRSGSNGEDAGRTDADLIALGNSGCTELKSGRATLSSLTNELIAKGYGADLSNAVVEAAEHQFCPRWTGR